MYRRFGNLEEFYSKRPVSTDIQISLLHGYYAARRELSAQETLTNPILERYASTIYYETDLAIWVMQRLDDHYMSLRAEKIRNESNK